MLLTLKDTTAITKVCAVSTNLICVIHTVSPMIILIQDKYFIHCSFGFRLTFSGMTMWTQNDVSSEMEAAKW